MTVISSIYKIPVNLLTPPLFTEQLEQTLGESLLLPIGYTNYIGRHTGFWHFRATPSSNLHIFDIF